jgi:transcriptional regulator with XRE-family HTH domain
MSENNNWQADPAAYLKSFRARHSLSQRALAEKLGVTTSRIEEIEQGRRNGDSLFPRALRDLEREISEQ